MIDLRTVVAGTLWVTGLAVVLAALSWANWEAKTGGERLRAALERPAIRRAIDGGLALFCTGLAVGAGRWWERALWGLLAAVWVALMVWPARRPSGPTPGTDTEHPQ